ncbi:MAG: GNAT family protein [Planctomycetota bacterium]
MGLPETVDLKTFMLAPLNATDADDLFAHFSDPDVTEHLDIDPLVDRAGAEAIIRWAADIEQAERGGRWVVRETSGAFVGTCGFNSITRDRASRGEIAFDLAKSHWGRGTIDILLPFLVATGFETLGLRRLEAFVSPENGRSARVLARHGFQHEGTLRDYALWKGRFWDQDVYARIAE